MFVRRSARAGVLPALVLSLALAGCGGDDEIEPKMPESSSAASTSTAESPSPTKPVEPNLPPEAEGDDAAAAEAFVRHYYDYVNYAQATGDTKGLQGLALQSCVPCDGAIEGLQRIYDKGGSVSGGQYSVRSLEVAGPRHLGNQARAYAVKVRVHNQAQGVTGTGTKLDRRYPASTTSVELRVVRDTKAWHIASWELRS